MDWGILEEYNGEQWSWYKRAFVEYDIMGEWISERECNRDILTFVDWMILYMCQYLYLFIFVKIIIIIKLHQYCCFSFNWNYSIIIIN